MKYTYSFCVWPDETWDFRKALYDYFRQAQMRVEMTFTPEEFERYRSEMSHDGFTLREVERWVYAEPESVL